MNRRELLTGAAFSGLGFAQSTSRPNILHIQSDQQQWATVAGRAQCNTPSLNRLANAGMLFERSYTPSAVCCPARAMLLSGAYHWHNGVYNQIHSAPSVHRDMFADVVLYSQRLRDAGYRLGYVGKWHASWERGPLQFGYHEIGDVASYKNARKDNEEHPCAARRTLGPLKHVVKRTMQWPGSAPFPMWGYVDAPEEAHPCHYRTDCAIEVMNRLAKSGSPWLLEAHYIEPHDPYFPVKKYFDRYDPRAIPVPASFHDTFEGKPGLHRRESESWGHVTPEDCQAGRAAYFAYTEQLDAQVGRLLKALDETGQADNTLVVFTTDHGDMNGAHRMWIKGWIPYEECYRVPLIVRWPGHVEAASRSSKLVCTHDLAHTYAAAAGARALPFVDGYALQPLFADVKRADWPAERLLAYYGGEFLYTQRIAIADRFKYVFNGFDIDEMYDLENDPGEMHNLAYSADAARYAGDMRARLYELMGRFEDPYGPGPGPRNSDGEKPNRYEAPRYLPRGKRL